MPVAVIDWNTGVILCKKGLQVFPKKKNFKEELCKEPNGFAYGFRNTEKQPVS